MRRLKLSELLNMGDLFHIWGEAGSGKTLLACAIAAEAIKEGHVRWVCTDGKRSFIRTLRANLHMLNGHNITVSVSIGHKEVQEYILSLSTTIHPETSLIVIDPITRVLDMSRQDSIMWGRELIEEALPSLVALNQKGVKVVLVSEVRRLEEETVPVMHDSISIWKPVDLHVVRSPGRESDILELRELGDEHLLARLTMDPSGTVRLRTPTIEGRLNICLENHSSA